MGHLVRAAASPAAAGEHLAARAALLDGTYREVAGRVPDTAQIVFDDDGRLHFAALEPEPEPVSLLELRAAVNAMLPRVDLPEVFSWTGADQAFSSVTGGEARLKDLHVTIAALLVAHGCNVGYTPVLGGVDALKYGRLSHVDQTYLRLVPTGRRTPRSSSTRHPSRSRSVGRRPGGLGGRDAVRRPRAQRVRTPEPEVLRTPRRRDQAEHDQRPGGRARREGRGRHPARLPVRA